MRALTLWQPYASLIGLKRIETRTWNPKYHGPILIHAANNDKAILRFTDEINEHLRKHGKREMPLILPIGCIVAVCELGDCRLIGADGTINGLPISPLEMGLGDYSPGRYAWFLKSIRRLQEPVECRGWQGLWNVPDDVVHEVFERLERQSQEFERF